MPNSSVVNLYPVPNDQATVKQASIAIPVSGSGAVSFTTLFGALHENTKYVVLDVHDSDAFVNYFTTATAANGHRLFVGRSYTWSKEAAEGASFINSSSSTAGRIVASEFTQ
jgi:ABC-type Mn2+/Zn2+ transport system ATPase subunit|tara:strand:+ start:115 stop:450 length:336 start_codon:yes stop_codon:yes gene_type:complete